MDDSNKPTTVNVKVEIGTGFTTFCCGVVVGVLLCLYVAYDQVGKQKTQ